MLDDLREAGEHVSRKRVARLMKERGLVGEMPKRWRHPSAAPSDCESGPNTLDRAFNVSAPNRVWASDITYIRTWEGWLYLAVVIDLFSRRVVGWSMQPSMHTDIVLSALTMAVGQRLPEPGLLQHSDRGSQYTSDDYQRALKDHGIECSLSGRGNCWDNAVVESFFGSLKKELISGGVGRPATMRPQPSMSTSRSSITGGAATRPTAASPQPPTRPLQKNS